MHIFENTTVDEAIAKGHRTVTYPGLLLMFVCFGLLFYFGMQKGMPVWIWPVGMVATLIFLWIFWSIRITKWKVWAFENVRNVHELEKRAIQDKLIWPRGSVFTKTEIWSAANKERWEALQSKFHKRDEFFYDDDLTVPLETIIYYSKAKNYMEMAIMIACFVAGIYFVIQSDKPIIGIFLAIFGGFLSIKEFREANNRQPQIILNERGIETVSTPFYAWKDIENEDVEVEHSGNNTRYYLTYEHSTGVERLLIDDYDIGFKELRRLLKIYRGRSLKH